MDDHEIDTSPESALFLRFRLNPYSVHTYALPALRRYIKKKRPDFLDRYYRSITRRVARDHRDAYRLLREIDLMPTEYKNRSETLIVRSDHLSVIEKQPRRKH